MTARPRYSTASLPPYSYVPGHTPHPISDPAGHQYALHQDAQHGPDASTDPLDELQWRASAEYLSGVDLFNHGFYWEAHEAWESLWHAAGRSGRVADWLKALIKLAAAAVKAREGNPRGVERHARRSLELVDIVTEQLSPGTVHFCGLSIPLVEAIARGLACEAKHRFQGPQPDLLLESWLRLD